MPELEWVCLPFLENAAPHEMGGSHRFFSPQTLVQASEYPVLDGLTFDLRCCRKEVSDLWQCNLLLGFEIYPDMNKKLDSTTRFLWNGISAAPSLVRKSRKRAQHNHTEYLLVEVLHFMNSRGQIAD